MARDGEDIKIMGERNYSNLKMCSKTKINKYSLENIAEQIRGNFNLDTECHRGSRGHTAQIREADLIGVSINRMLYMLV